jgi:hypothetical protein
MTLGRGAARLNHVRRNARCGKPPGGIVAGHVAVPAGRSRNGTHAGCNCRTGGARLRRARRCPGRVIGRRGRLRGRPDPGRAAPIVRGQATRFAAPSPGQRHSLVPAENAGTGPLAGTTTTPSKSPAGPSPATTPAPSPRPPRHRHLDHPRPPQPHRHPRRVPGLGAEAGGCSTHCNTEVSTAVLRLTAVLRRFNEVALASEVTRQLSSCGRSGPR